MLAKWLYPGLEVKRWLGILVLGIFALSLGIAYFITHLYRTQPFPEFAYYITLQFIDRPYRALLFAVLGVGVVVLALQRLGSSLLAVVDPNGKDSLVDRVYRTRRLSRGPKIVAIGGGTGLSTLLRGLKECTSNITAIVTVADDGGSSGRLRRALGVPPPGDFRQCIAALADTEPLVTELFQYRFGDGSGLDGHSFGNLFIVAMAEVTGSFERALQESSRVLAVRGQIIPSTLQDLVLHAELDDSSTLSGESKISESLCPIARVFVEPENPPAYPEAVKAILEADAIIIGPGSLYTSVLPNLLVKGVTEAIRSSHAPKVYVCNVATQPGETDNYTLSDHLAALERHVGGRLVDYVLANNHFIDMPPKWKVNNVPVDEATVAQHGAKLIRADLINEDFPTRHDPHKLAATLVRLVAST
ncbi:MAG: YvcK family protein [Dehalococcoidia bacterium]|nr:YvcK family protein [Dehalococcoidia bacterium]